MASKKHRKKIKKIFEKEKHKSFIKRAINARFENKGALVPDAGFGDFLIDIPGF